MPDLHFTSGSDGGIDRVVILLLPPEILAPGDGDRPLTRCPNGDRPSGRPRPSCKALL